MLTARKPGIQINQAISQIVWSKDVEFAHIFNGVSVVVPYVEHLLNSVMNEVRTNYAADNPLLKEELDLFIRQETNHSIYHNRFNKLMLDAGYDIKPVMTKITAELKALRDKRSLAFISAYCAGFENTATFTAQYVFEACDEFFIGADPTGANLWLWHIAEEFEHRMTCHEAFKAVSGNYLMRIWGFAYSFWHINWSFWRATAVLLKKERESMTPAQLKASRRNHMRLMRRQFVYAIPRMLPLLRPGFNPAKLTVPPKIAAALEFFKKTDPINEAFTSVYPMAAE
ncbi:metal-dependent hydrolase [Acidocella sp. KAb 2-4]|uniref:metal-dependent hydrolase n=1 Tax=Acidocella sp. KAb 2-4 TaxID=2885158 RepID=UPI001D084FE5|nr:metal-dependent hydrolase [Acidocella sp. KAb 2-4]MCB5944273.1 metal-dependent hydrolase [Acidocella sp. KAb 2-4]